MKTFKNFLFSHLNSMALKRLLKWAILESDRYKYVPLRGFFCCNIRFSSTNTTMVSLKPKTVYMRKGSDDLYFNVSMLVDYPPFKFSRIFNVRRPMESSLMLFLQRINLNIYTHMDKIVNKRKRTSKIEVEIPTINALLCLDEKPLSDDLVCKEIFELKGNLVLQLLNESYTVYRNSPWVNSISLPKNVKSNMIIQPLKFSSENYDMEKCSFTWFKSEKSVDESKTQVMHIKDWVEIGNGFIYRVTENEIGHYIKLECVPKNEKETGPVFTEVIASPVEYGECNYYYVNTHKLTDKSVGENKIRIVTYNVLAAMYTSTKEAKLLFEYCPSFALEKCQRFSAIAQELVGYNADLYCLQEVELLNFQSYLIPHLKELGYTGLTCFKLQDKEGTACIFKEDKFMVLASQNYVYGQEITQNPHLADILNYIKQNSEFLQKFTSLPHAIQFVALKSVEKYKEILIVGNVHLYSVADADLIRLLQVLSSFNLFQTFLEHLGTTLTDLNPSLILCGDFNSTPDSSIHELVMNGSLSSDHSIWKSEEMKDYEGLTYKLPVKMGNAYGTPEFTNYTKLFKGCLDYIYYQTDRLEVDKRYPLPSEEVLSENVGLPSIAFPSDHVPLIVDMKWKC